MAWLGAGDAGCCDTIDIRVEDLIATDQPGTLVELVEERQEHAHFLFAAGGLGDALERFRELYSADVRLNCVKRALTRGVRVRKHCTRGGPHETVLGCLWGITSQHFNLKKLRE